MTEFAPASALMIACLLLGVALVPLEWAGGCMLWLLAARLGSGLLALAGISGTYFSGRICYASLIPIIQIGAVMIKSVELGQAAVAVGSVSAQGVGMAFDKKARRA